MTDVFSKLGESLKSTIKEATQQTQKSVDQVTCRTDLLNKRSELKRLYEALGEVQYKAYIENEDNVERNVLYSKITTLKSEIQNLEEKLEKIVNTQKSSFDSYKRKVKTAWEEEKEIKVDDLNTDDGIEILKVCPVCNTGNHEHAAYCIKCGNKFE
ncbi:MAG: hypothetical protein U0L26_10275 [Cellulosilyticum sp.]|nr:hypothetical protein [Cellulosilyticum sp.]